MVPSVPVLCQEAPVEAPWLLLAIPRLSRIFIFSPRGCDIFGPPASLLISMLLPHYDIALPGQLEFYPVVEIGAKCFPVVSKRTFEIAFRLSLKPQCSVGSQYLLRDCSGFLYQIFFTSLLQESFTDLPVPGRGGCR